ncbi:MAG: YfhO family protein [Acidobacteria bacterium]|nr:YfhO family protein [Acidobacteriota bacterium]
MALNSEIFLHCKRLSSPRLSAWILLVAGAAMIWLAMPTLLGKIYVADDLGEFHLPIRSFYAKQLAAREPFEWMPQLYAGFYIGAEGQLGAYHPFHWILYRSMPLDIAFNLELLTSYPFLFWGTCLLLRRLTGSRTAGLYGALVFTFSSFMLLHFIHPNAIAVIAHLPWILLALDRAAGSDSRRRRALAEMCIGLLIGSQLLLGYPQCVWFTALTACLFLAWRYLQLRYSLKRIAAIAVAVASGVAIGAVQWAATLHLLANSVRKTLDAAFFNEGSLHPSNLVQLVAPYLFKTRVMGQNTHELGLYIGAVPLALCVWLLCNRNSWGRHRKLIRALIIFGILSLLLAAGEYGGLYRLQLLIPPVNRLRFPCRAIVLVQFCTAAIAGVALSVLKTYAKNHAARANCAALPLVIVAAVSCAAIGSIILPDYVSTPPLIWLGPALVILAVVIVKCAARGSQIALYILVLFTAVDLTAYGVSYSVWGKTARLADFIREAPRPPGQASARVVAPPIKEGIYIGNSMLLAGVTRVDGYAGLKPFRQLDYSQESTWRLAGAQWAYLPGNGTGSLKWNSISSTAPRAGLIGLGNARVEIITDKPGRIDLVVYNSASGVLFITESYDPAWRVTVDGWQADASRIQGDFLGCALSPGYHYVQFEFKPRCKEWGGRISLCGLGLLLMFCALRIRPVGANRINTNTPRNPA